jgi:nicotinate dehydrogenase subunit A
MALLNLNVNGTGRQVDVDPATPLLYVLSDDLGLKGPKFGCGLGQCGACTVLVNGRATRSCVTPVNSVVSAATREAAGGNQIVTLEGLGTPERPHPLQQAFIDEQAVQCGFCLSGVILTAKALLDRNPRATDADVQQELSGILCRCFVNIRFMKAIRKYADGRRA